jgi:hypothetical protein
MYQPISGGTRGAQSVEALPYEPEGRGLEFFIDNRSGLSMALRSTQPQTEVSTRNISWG